MLQCPTVYTVRDLAYDVHTMSTRDRLLNAARQILAKEGLSRLSVRQVAAACGVSPMAMYRHFADKDALIDALMLDGLSTWDEMVARIRVKDPIRWIERACEAFTEFAITDPHRFEAAFLLPARSASRYPDNFHSRRSSGLATAFARLEEAHAKGFVLKLPPERILPMISAVMLGMVVLYRSGRLSSEADLRKLSKTAIRDLLLLGTKDEAR